MGDTIRFILNDTTVETDLPAGTTALDYLRSVAGLTGTKEGCREGDCGACTVLIGSLEPSGIAYRTATSCLLALGSLDGTHVVTIEGLSPCPEQPSPVQQAFLDEGASQCGFCTPGFIVSLTGYLLTAGRLDEQGATMAVEGNICRCTGYLSIRRAMARLCQLLGPPLAAADDRHGRLAALVQERVVPAWFADIPQLLAALAPAPAPAPADPQPGQTILGGGTDLYVQRPRELLAAPLFPVGGQGLGRIWHESSDDCYYFGGGASTEAIRTSPQLYELIGEAVGQLRLISSLPIRHMATLAGNLVNASPIADLAIIFLALDATVGLRLGKRRRQLPLSKLYRGYKQLDLADGELIEWLRVPGRLRGCAFSFEKVAKRTHLDIASVNTAMALRQEDGRVAEAHVSAGGVAPIPLSLAGAAAVLSGSEPSSAVARQMVAAADAAISPISDMRGSAAYKRLLLRQLIFAHLNRLCGLEEGLP